MLADNIVWLKKNRPELYNQVKRWEEKGERPSFVREKTKDGNDTLKYQNDGQTIYLHSKYDPLREANVIIDQLAEREEISDDIQVLFYGIGLGYHLEAFIKRFPDTAFLIVEPSIEVLSMFLEQRSLKDFVSKNMKLLQFGNSLEELYNQIIQSKEKKIVICEHPVYPKIFKQDYAEFFGSLKRIIKEQRSSLNTNYAFKQRWIINSVNNFNEVLKTPNILMENNGIFEGKTAILVAAGPSLDYEIENLKRIKEEGLAFIFSVGSAINALIENDILPDVVCAYDPTNELYVYRKLNESEIENCPMIFGSSIGYDVVLNYRGSKFNMITSQDTISNYFLKTSNKSELIIVHDAPSIAVVTLELLHLMKFSKIILVGQNLALKGEKDYAQGIDYRQEGISGSHEALVTAKDVEGNEIFTRDSFNRMRAQMEMYINNYKLSVINTTKGGAQIEGAEYRPLETVIENNLKIRMVNGDEFEKLKKTDCIYDLQYLEDRLKHLNAEFDQYQKLLEKIKIQLNKLTDAAQNNYVKQTQILHEELDDLIRKLEANDFFRILALPMNRVEYELLVSQIQRIKKEKNQLMKSKQILKPTETFMNLLFSNLELNQGIMSVLNNNVSNFISERKA
jgi:hypothetical protein